MTCNQHDCGLQRLFLGKVSVYQAAWDIAWTQISWVNAINHEPTVYYGISASSFLIEESHAYPIIISASKILCIYLDLFPRLPLFLVMR